MRTRAPSTPPRSYQLLARWFERPRAVLWIACAIFVLSLPALATGLVADDYWIEAKVQRDPWGAFTFHSRDPAARRAQILTARDSGQMPWFADEHFAQAFMRPLGSITHAIDFRLWPDAVPFMHLENILAYVLVVWLAGALYAELGLPRVVVGFATLFYALSGNHTMSVSWLSGRNTLLATACGLFAILLHLRAARRTAGSRTGLQLLAAGSLAVGLLCAEFAAGAAGFVLAHALTLGHGSVWRRLSHVWPYALVLGVWQAAYVIGDYGVVGSGFYHGPLQEPGLFARGVIAGVPIYVATQLVAPIAAFSLFYPNGIWIVFGLSILMLVAMRGMLLPLLGSDPRARFLLLGAALAAIPLASTGPQDRLVLFVSFGTSAIVSMILAERYERANSDLPRAGANRLFRIHAGWLLAMYVPMLFGTARANGVGGGISALAEALATRERGAVLINAPSDLLGYYQALIRAHRGLPPLPFIDTLYSGGQAIELRRPTDRTLEVAVERGYFASTIERMLRNPARRPFRAGDVVQLPRMRVTVVEVNSSGGPTLVRFDFPDALERLATDFWVWDFKTPKPWPLPPVGSHVALAATPAFL